MLATPVNILFALAIAGLVSVPLPAAPAADAPTNELITPQQAAPGGGSGSGSDGGSGGMAANKFATAEDSVALFCNDPIVELGDCEAESGDQAVLLQGALKTSTPFDLIVQLTAECALWTQVLVSDEAAKGPTESSSEATITVWPVIVPLDATEQDILAAEPAAADVVFCNRVQEYEFYEEFTGEEGSHDLDNLTMRAYEATRQANAFNWILENPSATAGDNEFIVAIVGELTYAATEGEHELPPEGEKENFAYGGVGQRSLVVEPVKLF